MDPLSIGRSCYKQRDYEGALLAFTQGIKISTGHILLTALDHRAATFEKLNQLQPALKDAKEMIELKPELAKGYLRCAKILQLKGEESLALKIYERGLRKVKVGTDPDRPILQQMFNKFQQKQNPVKSFDPMVMLPPELAQMVCEHLDMRDRVICLAVSRPWKRFLEASHDLWTVLDVRSARRYVRLESLKAHLRRSNYGLDRAILTTNPQIFSGSNLQVLTRLSKKLSYLEITSTGYLGDSLLDALPLAQNLRVLIVKGAQMPLFSVVKALNFCPKLQSAEFNLVISARMDDRAMWPQLDSLESLRFTIQGAFGDPMNLDRLVSCTPNLRSAALVYNITEENFFHVSVDFSLWSRLEHLQLNYTSLSGLPSLPQTLRYLDLSENHVWPPSRPTEESVTAIDLPLLETFICARSDFSLANIFKIIGPSVKARHLKSLHIGSPQFSDLYEDYSFLPDGFSMPSLVALSLGRYQEGEDGILKFLRLCPAVQHLDVSFTKITGVAIKELMMREKSPKRIVANGCTCLSSDAVEWARSLGTEVEYNNEPVRRPAGRRNWRDRFLT